jgi:Tfp pilus assembly protein PilF
MHPIRLILTAVLLCLCSLAFSQTPSPAAFKELQELQSAQQKKLDELATTNAALAKSVQDKTIAIEQAAIFKNIETDRKSIEWWFAALGIMTTVVAALSAFFPFFLGLKEKELLKAQLENARDLVNSIKDQHGVALKTVEEIDQLKTFNSGNNASQSDADAQGIAKELKAVTNNPQQYSPVDRLRARAVQASKATSPTSEQSQHAYELWKALTLLDTSDANAQFNAGIFAHAIAKNGSPLAQKMFAQACSHYEQALAIKPDMHDAANNWGGTLDDQAKALNSQDPEAAQALWAQAVTKYRQALAIKPNMYKAANNWGATLIEQANALSSKDPEAAQKLWAEAAELLAQYAIYAPLMMSFNLACVYSRLDKLDMALAQLEICRAGNDLPDNWRTDDDLAHLRDTVGYVQWEKKHFPKG